jgi:hypothetical protein
MAYDPGNLKPLATLELYVLRLEEDDRQAFFDEPESRLTELLKKGGAPDPNRVVVLRASDPANDIIEDIIAQIESGTTGGGSHPPVTAVFHEVSGPHPSTYITIVGGA